MIRKILHGELIGVVIILLCAADHGARRLRLTQKVRTARTFRRR